MINYLTILSGNEITIPAQSKRYIFDLRGNLLDDLSTTTTSTTTTTSASAALYGYGPDNELLGVVNPKDKKIEVYCYNYKLERTCKERFTDKTRTNYYYNQSGQLLSENTGTTWRDYVYLGEMLVAMVDSNTASPNIANVYYVHNNHLPAPTLITNSNRAVTWQAKYDPFGKATVTIFNMVNNIRLPGQYYDDITGLHYNYFRHYHPGLGRYMQSDPIGLGGGVNTYAYVGGNPVNLTDRLGLAPGDSYPSPNAAALAAIREINPISIMLRREYAGNIYQKRSGAFSYTKPRKGSIDSSWPGFCLKGKKVADYHTHGGDDQDYDNENFSGADIDWNDRKGIMGYLGTPSGDIKVYIPSAEGLQSSAITIGIGAN